MGPLRTRGIARIAVGATAATLAACALSLVPSRATAWDGVPPGDRPANNALIDQFVTLGEAFWQGRGVHPCPSDRLNARLADDLSDGIAWEKADGRADLAGCTMWIKTSLIRDAQSAKPGSDAAIYACRIVVHELGHTGGLDDEGAGVMDPAADFRHGTPWPCRAWAAKHRHGAAHKSPPRRVKHRASRSEKVRTPPG